MKKCLLFLFAILVFASCEQDYYGPEENFIIPTEEQDNGDDSNETEGQEGSLTLYRVTGDAIDKVKDYSVPNELLNYQQDDARHQEIWDFVVRLLPSEARTKIAEFEIFYGNNELLGYVQPIDENDLSRWRFALAIDVAGDLSTVDFSDLFTFVTIHEYAHVLTLNDDQVDVTGTERDCNSYFTGEGCSLPQSYINRFFQLGWADIYENHDENEPDLTYDRYRDRFVSDYAATNPGEDIAEVFSFFITQTNAPSGNSIADQKIKLMYEYPELVEMRDRIRASGTVDGLTGRSLGTHRAFTDKFRIHGHGNHKH